MRSFVIVVAFLGWAAGCVHAPAAAPPPRVVAAPAPPPPPAPRKKLAVLPVEKLLLPKVAEALNERLTRASVDGVDTTTAPISMDMALLQVDCAEPPDQCYGRIAKKLEADRLLWGEIEQARARKKKTAAPTTVRIVLYDVEKAAVIGRAEETFSGSVPGEALDEMLARATVPPAKRKVAP
jgi:hypothetical protein